MPKTKPTKRATASKKKPAAVPQAAELFLEIGVEELPYQFIAPALASLKMSTEQALADQRLAFESIQTLGTPRRLALVVRGLKTQQDSVVKEAMGPSKAVAFDLSGQPTKAAMGFAAGQGVAVQDLQVRQTPKGEYLFAVKREEGRAAKAVLQEVLPQLVGKLSFPKAMKWNEAGVRFARPVRWLVALFGGAVLPIEAAGIKAGNKTYGHRVLGAKQGAVVRDFAGYVKALEAQGVVADPARRRVMIDEQIAALCKKTGFALNQDAALLDQAVYTTESPNAIIGSFKDLYLDVPEEILITSMKEHQGFFSLRDKKSGKLVAHFIAVTNNRVKDMGLIREGNERVLAARLADAKFFYDDDRTTSLQERVAKLAGVTFHQKIGTMGQKQARVAALSESLAVLAELNETQVALCRRAGNLCKADLLTGIVGEFPELQGVMGGYYARHDGEDPDVSRAILQHYRPHSMEGPIPESGPGQILSLADRLDSLAAFFHVGMVPTGSEDPFALRRHATAVVRIALEGTVRLNVGQAIRQARTIVESAGIKAVGQGDGQQRLVEFVCERVRHYARTVHGLRDDVVTAVLSVIDRDSFDLRDLVAKMQALQTVTARAEFDPLIVGFKRAHRLVEKEQWDRRPVDPAGFQHPTELALHEAASDARSRMTGFLEASDYARALDSLVRLKPAIDAFFAAVMVNAEDKAVRSNRLSLLKNVDDLFMSFADFSQIVVQGS